MVVTSVAVRFQSVGSSRAVAFMEILKKVFRVEDVSSDPVGGGEWHPLAIQTFAPGDWKKKVKNGKTQDLHSKNRAKNHVL